MPLTEWHLPIDVDVQVDDMERVGQRSLTEDMAVGPDHDLVEDVVQPFPSFDDKVRGGLAFVVVIAFLVLASTSLVIPALAKPVAFSLGAVGSWMVRPVIQFYFSRTIRPVPLDAGRSRRRPR